MEQLHEQYTANADMLATMHLQAVDTCQPVNGYTADKLKEVYERFELLAYETRTVGTKQPGFKFQVDDDVEYVLHGGPMFGGKVIRVRTQKKMKPYIILQENGTISFANERHLRISSTVNA